MQNHTMQLQEAIRAMTTSRDRNSVITIGDQKAPIHVEINRGRKDDVGRMVKENAVMVFAGSGCCMSHVVKRLLQCLGVNPAVYEVEKGFEDLLVAELREADGCGGGMEESVQFPVVFVGGRWFGGLDRIMATHIRGELTPLLKQAGALWL